MNVELAARVPARSAPRLSPTTRVVASALPPVTRVTESVVPIATRRPVGAPGPAGPVHWLVPVVVAVVGMFLSVLDSTIVGVALPVIGKDLYINSDDLGWVNTAFRVSEAVVVPATAWLATRLGLRRMYLISLVLFAAFSMLCSLAWDLTSLVALRVLQAIPGSMTPVASLAIIFRMVPPAKRGLALSLYGLGIVSAPGLAPLIGGLLVQHGAWRTIFYLDAPVALLGLIAALIVLPPMPATPGRRFDLPGFLSAGFGLSALTVALAQAPQWGATSYPVLILATYGTLALALFVIIELQVDQPLLQLRAFTHRPFLALAILIDLMFVGITAVLLYLPQFLAQAQQLSPTDTGLLLLPQALLWMAMMPVAGMIYARFGARWPAVIGLTLTAIGTLALAGITIDAPRPALIGWLTLRAFGLGLTLVPILAAGMSALPPPLVNDGSALRTLFQRILAGMGLTLLSAMQQHQQAQLFSDRAALMRTATNPQLAHLAARGHATLTALWQQLTIRAATDSYTNVFLIVGALTLIAALLAAWLLPTGNPTTSPKLTSNTHVPTATRPAPMVGPAAR